MSKNIIDATFVSSGKPVIFIDVDGTLFDTFRKDDNRIIKQIFGKNPLVKFTDSVLWGINGMDFISNTMGILKLRFAIYGVLGLKKYNFLYNEYQKLYKQYLEERILTEINFEELLKIEEDYKIIIVTNNPFSMEVIKKYFTSVVYVQDGKQRLEVIKNCAKHAKVEYIIGNNYSDDIKSARAVGAKSIYIGKSPLRKCFNADFYTSSFKEAISHVR